MDADFRTQADTFLNKEPNGAVGARTRWKDRDYLWLGFIMVGHTTFAAYEASSGTLVFAAASGDIVGSGTACGEPPGEVPGPRLEPLEAFLETLKPK